MIRQVEGIAVEIFIEKCFQDRRIITIVHGWRIEPEKLVEKAVTHFREMGILMIYPFQGPIIMEALEQYLSKSNEIVKIVKQAEFEEQRRQQSRHA